MIQPIQPIAVLQPRLVGWGSPMVGSQYGSVLLFWAHRIQAKLAELGKTVGGLPARLGASPETVGRIGSWLVSTFPTPAAFVNQYGWIASPPVQPAQAQTIEWSSPGADAISYYASSSFLEHMCQTAGTHYAGESSGECASPSSAGTMQGSGALGTPAYQSPCVLRGTGYQPEDDHKECGFCTLEDHCDPGLVCHCGVCRKPSDPDVACERGDHVWDYNDGVCTDAIAPNPCDMANLSSSGGIQPTGAEPYANEQGNVPDAYKGLAAADIITGMTTLAGNVGGGFYAYRAKGGFWWTLLGVLVGGLAGNLTGRLVTLPLR